MKKSAHLKLIREKRGLSKDDVAKALNITHAELDMIENGNREIDKVEAEMLANLYKIKPTYLESNNVLSDTQGFIEENFEDLSSEEQKDLLKLFGTLRKED